MKNILKVILTVFVIALFSGCAKKYSKLSYSEFNEYFSTKIEYSIIDKTNQYDIDIRKFLEAGEGNYQIFYIEFSNKKNADNYINKVYSSDKNNKIKKKKNYTYIKRTKGEYMKLYKVDNVIVIGKTKDKKYKKNVRKVLKDLGY